MSAMRQIPRIGLLLCFRIIQRWRRWWYTKAFRLSTRYVLSSAEVGNGNTFNVPVRCDGGGKLRVGARNVFGYAQAIRFGSGEILLEPRVPSAVIEIGTGNWFSNNVSLIAMQQISVGDGCQFGDMVTILDSDFHEVDPVTRNRSAGVPGRVVIGNNVWLGSRVMILKGVAVGDNSVIGPMSVVTKSVPSNSLAVGSPARVIRSIGGNGGE